MFAIVPLLAVPVLVYNIIALTMTGGFMAVDAAQHMDQQLFAVHMTSHIDWAVRLGDLLLCLVEFLLAPAFATSTFFLLSLMVLLDVLAGFIVTIVTSRRDLGFSDE
jgi:hypothetical protein